MDKIDDKNKEGIQFDGVKLISNTVSSIILVSAYKVADILDFWKKQVDKARFLIQEKERFNKKDESEKKVLVKMLKEIACKVSKSINDSIKLLEQSKKLPDIPWEKKEEDI